MPYIRSGGSLLLPLQIDGYTFERLPYVGSIDEKISAHLRDQLPDFVVDNYETFKSFVEAYYEWSEQYGNPRAEGVRIHTYSDIDKTLDDFLEYFRETYIENFPFTKANGINEKTLIKNIGDFYRSKGSVASFELLFRILYNTTINIDYPKNRILKLSDSTFDDRKYLRTECICSIDEAKNTEGTIVKQIDPRSKNITASALIDEVQILSQNGIDFFSFAIKDVSGEFNLLNKALFETTGISAAKYEAVIFPTLDKIIINDGGENYNYGDRVTFKNEYNDTLLIGSVDNIAPDGGIRGFNLIEFFGIYTTPDGITYSFDSTLGSGASLSVGSQTIVSDGPDSYFDDTGKLSSRSFIQDSFFYQNYSYIIRVNKTLEEFSAAVKKLAHPAGTIMFAEYVNETLFTDGYSITENIFSKFTPVIGHYLPHTMGMTIDPRGYTHETGAGSTFYDFYPTGYNGQDGRTFGDFIDTTLSNGTYGTPHLYPYNGITHNPRLIYKNDDTFVSFDSVETSRTLINGAIGSTGYIGATTDSDGEHVGLYGFFPVGSSRTNTSIYGITTHGGYTSPLETSLSGGFSGGQLIMVGDTDSSTADYWVVHRHPNTLGIQNIGVTGSRKVVKIPLTNVLDANIIFNPLIEDRSGYDAFAYEAVGFTLNAGATYVAGELVRQKRYREGEAIGRVINFEAGSQYHGPYGPTDIPIWNAGIDYLTVEVMNGEFTAGDDITRVAKPVIGDLSNASRFIEPSYNTNINIVDTIVYDTSWLDIPIQVMVNEVEYDLTES